ncbi:unnamed protein product [Mortierella alpina]
MSEDYVVEIPADPLAVSTGSALSTQQLRELAPERTPLGPVTMNCDDGKLVNRSEGQLSDSGFDHRSPHQESAGQDAASDRAPPLRFYFEECKAQTSTDQPVFNCTTELKPPARMEASHRFTRWTGGNTKEAKQANVGIFNIVLGLSLANLNMDCVESFAFSFGPGAAHSYGPLEIIEKHELLRLNQSQRGVFRWSLHQQHHEWKPAGDTFTVEMEIRSTNGIPRNSYPGFVELHFMELDALQIHHINDPSMEFHRPFRWSIDVAHMADYKCGSLAPRSVNIIHHTISGDGKYAATVSALDSYLQLDLWDLESDTANSVCHAYSALNAESWKPFHPTLCAQARWPLKSKVYPGCNSFVVSVSWDASVIVLMSDQARYLEDTLFIFRHEKAMHLQPEKDTTSSPASRLIPFEGIHTFAQVRAGCKSGKFHIISQKNQDIKDELFVVCNGVSVAIYSIYGQWKHVRTIQLLEIDPGKPAGPTIHRRLIDGIRTKYFSWTDSQGTLLVCNLENGLLVSRIPESRNAHFSSDGRLLAVRHQGNVISTRWTEYGVAVAFMDGARSNPAFMADSSSDILLPLSPPDEMYGRSQLGIIMDATTLSLTGRDRVSTPFLLQEGQQFRFKTIDGRRYIYSVYGSKLSLVGLDAITLKPYAMSTGTCGQRCFEEQSAIRDRIIPGAGSTCDFVMPSGLRFGITFPTTPTVEWSQGSGRQSISVSVSNGQITLSEALRIPAAFMGDIPVERLEYKVAMNTNRQEMVVYSDVLVMVWSLPTTLHGPFNLLLTWWTQLIPFQVKARPDWYWTSVTQCTHGQYYLSITEMDSDYNDVVVDMMLLHTPDAFSYSNSVQFLDGILVLIEVFGSADEAFRAEIIRYVGHHLNMYPNPDDLLESVLAKICQSVTQRTYSKYAAFLQVLFDSPHGRWVPRPDFEESTNPLCILLQLAEKMPRVMDLVHVLIRYCTRMANKEKSLLFVLPLMSPLHKLLKQKQLYSESTRSLLQGLAFLPAKDRAYIIEHHTIAHPPGLRWRFWRPNQQKLYECKDPVLQLDRDPLSKEFDPQNDNFTADLFVASFDMLWQPPNLSSESGAEDCQATQSVASMIFHMIKLNLKLKSRASIRRNDFALESLDNPAIVALVEYKWNTIGFTYWLYRFFFQCIYYLLVLTAVFMQVYSSSQGSSLFGVFVAIIVLSVIFLWLELVQLVHNWQRFLSSPYNYADVATFAVPLAGSLLQLFNIQNGREDGQVYLLSFSVLLIFIHFLFELRISKTVCHFVTIIIRIMSEIRVFFVVFSAGIIAFTIAILHMLHACPTDDCKRAGSKFPVNFFGAFSSTYFFMGGRYDSVSNEFEDNEWSFHVMMIIYFFFTAILLLNVLIALINVAFEVGDNNWRLVWLENRLACVESAENMTYHIPGFRQAHNWFPKEIYYSSTIAKVREYQAKHLDDDEAASASHRLFGQDSRATAAPDAAANKFAAILTLHQERETKDKEFQQAIIDSMRKELQVSQAHLSALQSQIREQQQSFELQIRELKLADATEVKELKSLLVSALEREPKRYQQEDQ